MAGTFQLKTAKDGQTYFTLVAGNGEPILSSEMYKARASAENGIESVRKNSQREGAFELKTATNGKAYFVLKATNGQVVGQSQMYASEASAKGGIESVQRNAPDAKVVDQTA
jgi:uncharacterized protein YegP (UPF0339 family)